MASYEWTTENGCLADLSPASAHGRCISRRVSTSPARIVLSLTTFRSYSLVSHLVLSDVLGRNMLNSILTTDGFPKLRNLVTRSIRDVYEPSAEIVEPLTRTLHVQHGKGHLYSRAFIIGIALGAATYGLSHGKVLQIYPFAPRRAPQMGVPLNSDLRRPEQLK